jgi:hypothetical protein
LDPSCASRGTAQGKRTTEKNGALSIEHLEISNLAGRMINEDSGHTVEAITVTLEQVGLNGTGCCRKNAKGDDSNEL